MSNTVTERSTTAGRSARPFGSWAGPGPQSSTKPRWGEAGYSLVEVLASIVILSIAIIPMVGMFDMGLQSATKSGRYDEARALANEKLEQAKSLPYDSTTTTDLKDNFPYTAPAAQATDGSTTPPVTNATDTSVPGGMSYTVRKRFLRMTTSGSTATLSASGAAAADGLIEVEVTVSWDDNSYTTTAVVARGSR